MPGPSIMVDRRGPLAHMLRCAISMWPCALPRLPFPDGPGSGGRDAQVASLPSDTLRRFAVLPIAISTTRVFDNPTHVPFERHDTHD